MKLKQIKLLPLILFHSILFQEGNAQIDSARLDFLQMTLEELLDREVISASRIEEKISVAPASIHIITEDQIRTRGYLNLEEILEDIPEVEVQKKASVEYSNYITIRGIDGSEKFIIMMDGMRINSPTGTPLAIVYNYPVTDARQVEVILGPASALYGVDAFTGVINIITKKGKDLRGISLNGSIGSYTTTHNTLVAGIGRDEISFLVSGSYYYSKEPFFPDLYPEEYSWYNEEYRNNGAMQVSPWDSRTVTMPVEQYETPTMSYAVHAKLNIHDLEVGYFRNFESHSSSLATLPQFTVYSGDALYKFLVESFYTSYNYTSGNGKWRLLTMLSHSRDEIDPKSLYMNTYTSYFKGYKYAFNRSLKLEEKITRIISENSSLIAGISYEDFTALAKSGDLPFEFNKDLAADFQNIYYLGTNISDREGNDLTIQQDFYYLQYQNLGTYLQWRTNFREKLNITLGGRFDYNSRYKATINPRAGLVYTPFKELKIKLLYGKAYLSPSPYRQYQHYGSFQPVTDSVSGEVTGLHSDFWRLPAEKLESQRISTYELGFSYAFNSNLILGVNGFINDMDDILSSKSFAGGTFKGVPVTNIERPVNEGEAFSYGGTTRIDFKKNWESIILNTHLAYSYIDGEIGGRQIPFAAKHTFKAVLDLDMDRFTSSLRYIHRSRSYHRSLRTSSGELVSSEPYGLLNLSARYNLLSQGRASFDLFLKINNLLNTKYYNVPVGGAESIPMAPQDPIRILLGIHARI
jgi:iron complex outermembrane receptor protein